jgi:ketosteroid isomerase-like protein
MIQRLTMTALMIAGLARMATAQATAKPPSSYNQQEREAVEVVKGWIGAWRAYDVENLMSYMADSLVFRADPSEPLQYGRDGFRQIAQRVMNGWSGIDLQEVFVVGGETDTVALFKRVDYFPGNGRGAFSGLAVPVAVMFRVKGGKITEWLDAPLIPVGPGAPPMPGARGRGAPPPGAPLPAARGNPPSGPPASAPGAPPQAWATSKPSFIWNQQERDAADIVRAWVDAWATKDPQRVAEYLAENCIFRGNPSEPLQQGRAAFVTRAARLIGAYDMMKIDELFVTGTEWDTAVLIKRADGIATFFRVKNRRITEWLDVPTLGR